MCNSNQECKNSIKLDFTKTKNRTIFFYLVPKIVSTCTEYIEKYGIVTGIYRLSGFHTNLRNLRNAFDEENYNEINNEIYINDVYSVSSLLKMFFRDLPNPLLTYQLYEKFAVIFYLNFVKVFFLISHDFFCITKDNCRDFVGMRLYSFYILKPQL